MLSSPAEIFARADALLCAEQSFVMATVIEVRGSASARVGAKALFDAEGRNLYGYIGGGCTEAQIAAEAREALQKKATRIVEVNLDDELFGLMPCGGIMQLYLEPFFAVPQLILPAMGKLAPAVRQFGLELGFRIEFAADSWSVPADWSSVFVSIATAISQQRGTVLGSLRLPSDLPELSHAAVPKGPIRFILFGKSRISEELEGLLRLLGFFTEMRTPLAHAKDSGLGSPQLFEEPIDLDSSCCVVIAGHHRLDEQMVRFALDSGAFYVALVASRKRSRLCIESLRRDALSENGLKRLYAPAGFNLPAETPRQIAFAILCEVLLRVRK